MEFVTVRTVCEVAVITLDRQKQLNALNLQLLEELEQTLDQLDLSHIRCVVIKGAGDRAFVAGADIAQMQQFTPAQAKAFSLYGNRVFQKIEDLPVPVIAAVNGYALGGGCELALACDMRIASEKAVFGLPETSLGILPGFGGTRRLANVVGMARAKELIFTGKRIEAQRALEYGLVSYVYPNDGFINVVLQVASTITANAPIAIANAKQAINGCAQIDNVTASKLEAALFAQCFATQDQKNAMDSFVNKTPKQPFTNS